jgi:hypothetical protein
MAKQQSLEGVWKIVAKVRAKGQVGFMKRTKLKGITTFFWPQILLVLESKYWL